MNNVQQKHCSVVTVGFYFHLVSPALHMKWGTKTQGHGVEDRNYCIWNKNIQTYTFEYKKYILDSFVRYGTSSFIKLLTFYKTGMI